MHRVCASAEVKETPARTWLACFPPRQTLQPKMEGEPPGEPKLSFRRGAPGEGGYLEAAAGGRGGGVAVVGRRNTVSGDRGSCALKVING